MLFINLCFAPRSNCGKLARRMSVVAWAYGMLLAGKLLATFFGIVIEEYPTSSAPGRFQLFYVCYARLI